MTPYDPSNPSRPSSPASSPPSASFRDVWRSLQDRVRALVQRAWPGPAEPPPDLATLFPDPDFRARADRLIELILRADHIVALTGAGISTEAGIPDFRGAGGLWQRYDPYEAFSLDGFRRNPAILYEVGSELRKSLLTAEPTRTHDLLVLLEEAGKLQGIITQNIDGLHTKAGSRRVFEVHGTMTSSTCIACGESFHQNEVERLIARTGIPPRCPACSNGIVKPDVILFGEMLPQDAISQAIRLASGADLMLIIGSSLAVAPVSDLPHLTLENFGQVAILNQGTTPLDSAATITLPYQLGQLSEYLILKLSQCKL